MILRAIVVATILFMAWMIVVRCLPKDLDSGQTLWGENVIHAQDYLYTAIDPTDLTIVGSSLSENLTLTDIDDRRVHNLGFSGQGIHDGFNVIQSANKLPGYVLVEINVVMKEENEQFRKVVLNPFANLFRGYLPAIRQRNQPVGVLKEVLFGEETIGPKGKQDTLRDRKINQLSLEVKLKEYAEEIQEEKLMEVLTRLEQRVQWLQKRGVKILFYEMPIHPDLCGAPKAVSIRNGFRKVFSPETFSYIDQPNCAAYGTTDGHHLGERSNANYSTLLGEEVGRLIE